MMMATSQEWRSRALCSIIVCLIILAQLVGAQSGDTPPPVRVPRRMSPLPGQTSSTAAFMGQGYLRVWYKPHGDNIGFRLGGCTDELGYWVPKGPSCAVVTAKDAST